LATLGIRNAKNMGENWKVDFEQFERNGKLLNILYLDMVIFKVHLWGLISCDGFMLIFMM
jgi:hypothetical protein